MSSTPSVKKPIERILDPTRIGTWNFVRHPPIDRSTIIQGKLRNPNSNAFKERQKLEGIRLRKALDYLTHGKNIFAYHNIRTNQVIYSLTRYLEKNNVLRQLLYHGKKTVPATLRMDTWAPYYSVHFNDARSGLRAYHLLREFSLQRQLDPPREMITITEEFLKRKRPRDPKDAKEFDERYDGKVGWLMEKKDRARAVMDQKATSVADIAAVLKIQEDEVKEDAEGDGQKKLAATKAGQKRQRIAQRKQKAYASVAAERIANLEKALSTAEVTFKVETPRDEGSSELVKILWNDVHDAHYAESWPDRVRHGEMERSRDYLLSGRHGTVVIDRLGEVESNEITQPQ